MLHHLGIVMIPLFNPFFQCLCWLHSDVIPFCHERGFSKTLFGCPPIDPFRTGLVLHMTHDSGILRHVFRCGMSHPCRCKHSPSVPSIKVDVTRRSRHKTSSSVDANPVARRHRLVDTECIDDRQAETQGIGGPVGDGTKW